MTEGADSIQCKIPKAKYADLFFVLSALIYRSMLDWAYIIVSSYYTIQFKLNINEIKLLISYFVVLILCLLTVHKNGAKIFLMRLLLFIIIIPNTSVYGMRNESSLFFCWVTMSFAVIQIVILRLRFRWKKRGERQNIFGKKSKMDMVYIKKRPDSIGRIINLALMFFSIMTIIIMYIENGLPGTLALNLYKVYDVRGSYRASKYLRYAISLVSTVIVPFGLADGYITGVRWKFVFYTLIQIMLFLWTGNKVFLFSLIIITVAIIIIKYRLSLNLFFYGIAIVVFAGNLSCVFKNKAFAFVFSLVNRRMLLDPAALKYFYYDYFIINEKSVLGFGGTILAPLLGDGRNPEYRYDLSSRYTDMISNANTGLYGGDFANLGVFAFIIVPVLIIILFYLINRVERFCGSEFAILLFVYTVYYLNETCIFLYLLNLTGILLIAIAMLYRYKYCRNMCISFRLNEVSLRMRVRVKNERLS